MKKTLAIALYTFRDAIRNKILYSIVFFALVLILLSMILGSASMSQDRRFIVDIGFQAIGLFLDMIAVFLGVTSVYQEMEKKTIYNLLSKPIQRSSYFLGKFIGLAITMLVQLVIMGVFLTIAYLIKDGEITSTYLWAFWLIYLECLIVSSVAFLFSSFSTPYVSGYLSIGVLAVGRLVQELENFLPQFRAGEDATEIERMSYEFGRPILTGLVRAVPDFNIFTLSTQITYQIDVSAAYLLHASIYGVSYAAFFLILGAFVFQRRDFI